MRVFETQQLTLDQVGARGGEAYLATTAEHTLLYDSGYAFAAPAMIKSLEVLLEGRPLDYLFLTHSHYDHALGSAWIKQCWPESIILGSAHAAQVFERQGARKTMQRLDKDAALYLAESGEIDPSFTSSFDYAPLELLALDKVVEEGDTLSMGSIVFEVLAAPGHTHCSLMLWCPEEGLLFGSESIGVMINDELVNPCCLTGYRDALKTIEKASALNPRHILLNHRQVVSDNQAALYLKNARYWTREAARIIWKANGEGKTREELEDILKDIFYLEELQAFYPKAAFELNNGYVVDQLLLGKESSDALAAS